MNLRERLSGIWLMATTLLSLCAYTAFFVSGMDENILVAVYNTLPVLQVVTLIVYLWGTEKLKLMPLKLLYRVFYASSVLVIPSFLFIFAGLISQYHVQLKDCIDATSMPAEEILPKDETVVYNTGKLYVYFPEYSRIDHVCKDRPSQSDDSITWCSGAAFQHNSSIQFDHINIEGDHAEQGTLHESPYNNEGFAAFVFYDGKFAFEFDNPTQAIKDAANAGGSGFMQLTVMQSGEVMLDFDRSRARCYRVLAELNGNVCIIDTVNLVHPKEFIDELKRIGVTNALYMDMGAGWNYSWYRDAYDKVVTLFGLPVPWSHNWVVFRK